MANITVNQLVGKFIVRIGETFLTPVGTWSQDPTAAKTFDTWQAAYKTASLLNLTMENVFGPVQLG